MTNSPLMCIIIFNRIDYIKVRREIKAMKVFSIISEYNPLHQGHLYQINALKKNNESFVIAFMSGSFVQRGEPAFISKFDRSKSAVLNGVDLVLEMPTLVSLQSAQYFSFGSVQILNKLNICDFISFGYESLDFSNFKKIISLEENFQDEINNKVNLHISQGLSYKSSYAQAIKELDPSIDKNVFLANNTLALEYIKSLKKLESPISIFPIPRSGANYDQENLDENGFQSATSIRLAHKKGQDISSHLPKDLMASLKGQTPPSLDDLSSIFYQLAFVEKRPAQDVPGYENGMLNLLRKNYYTSLEDMVEKSHNKRYSKSRLRRFVLNYILGLSNEDVRLMEKINYIKPLAFNEKGAFLLSLIKEQAQLEIINKPKDISKLDDYNKRILSLDYKAYNLYCLKRPDQRTREFTNNPFIPVQN